MKAGGLVVKIYLYSVLTLVVALGILVAFIAAATDERRMDRILISEHVVVDMAQRRGDPDILRGDVVRLKQVEGIKVSLYDTHGTLIATTADPPLPLPPLPSLAPLAREDFIELAPWTFAHAVRENGALVAIGIAVHDLPPSIGSVLARTIVILLLLLGGIALVFSRHLARPLQSVVGAAERFGRGDLSIRIRTTRRDEIGAVGRAFDEMADRVGRLVTSQQELMANVSHELQTPLSRIRVAVDLMSGGDASRAEEMLTEITVDLEELEVLIEDVMTLARLDLTRAGSNTVAQRLRRERVSLTDLVQRSRDRFVSLHDTHTLAADIPRGLPEIQADPVLLRRAIDNVIDNARKYSAEGSRIELTARDEGGITTIVVVDHGIGIDPRDLDHIFTPFFRGDRSRSRTTGGTGLGLALARRVVEAHGGTIGLTSVVGAGTTVTSRLPTQAPELAAAA